MSIIVGKNYHPVKTLIQNRWEKRVEVSNGLKEMYVQTRNGNTPMIAPAEKPGFRQVCRKKGIRTVRGRKYDALTFRKVLERNRNSGENQKTSKE